MRAGAQGIAAKVLVGLIVFVLALFGFGSIGLFSVSEPVAANVNGDDISQRVLDAETSRQRALYRSQYGEVPDALLDSVVSRRVVLDRLVDQTLIGQAAAEMDLSVDPDAVLGRIRASFAEAGGYDDGLYRRRLAELGFTPATFQASRASEELRAQLGMAFRDTAFVTGRELRRTARVQSQRRDIAWLLFDVETLAATVVIEEAEIEGHYGTQLDSYMTEERFDFDFVRLSRSRFEEDVEVAEEDIELAYRDEVAAVEEPRRRASHILLEIGAERSVEDAQALLREARAEIVAGTASFEEKARALSEDPATAVDGGDLGASGKGVFPSEFEAALWSLEPGQLSEPVETEFGVHLIKLAGIEVAEVPSLDERRDEIAEDLRSAEVQRRFDEARREMDTIAFEQGDSLDGLVDEYGLAVEDFEGATRNSTEGPFADRRVRDEWFSDEVLIESFNSRAVPEGDSAMVVGRLRSRHAAMERPLAEVRDEIRSTLSHMRAEQLAEDAAYDALTGLAGGESPAEVASRLGVEWQTADGVDMAASTVPTEILGKTFEMAAPVDGNREAEVATLADGSRALVLLSNVTLGDYSTIPETDRATLTTSLGQLNSERDFAALLRSLRATASVEAVNLAPPETL